MAKLIRKIMRMKRPGFLTVINPRTGRRHSGLATPRKAFTEVVDTAKTIEQPKRIVAGKKKKKKRTTLVTGKLTVNVGKKTLLG